MLKEDEGTHVFGGHLDQVFTNLPLKSYELRDVPFSYHKAIIVDLLFEKSDQDLDIRMIPKVRKMNDIRRVAAGESTAARIVENPNILERPILVAI